MATETSSEDFGRFVLILGGICLGVWLNANRPVGARVVQGQAVGLSSFVIPLEAVKRQSGAKAWVASFSGETHVEKWISDQDLASALNQLGETAFLYNAYYEPDQCLPPFCSVSSAALRFGTPEDAQKAQQLLLAYYDGELANKRSIDLSGAQAGRCLGGEVDHYYLITCTAVIDRTAITVQVGGTTQISPAMEQAVRDLVHGVEVTAASQ